MTELEAPFIKVCGICSVEDALVAEQAGASAIGIVMAKSSRQVLPADAAEIVEAVSIPAIGVFKSDNPVEIAETARVCGFDVVQLHSASDETVKRVAAWYPSIRAHKFTDEAFEPVGDMPVLVDSKKPGSGEVFDWAKVSDSSKLDGIRFILAGGLNPENVAEAIAVMKPFGVDVSSGVCGDDPRVKDPAKVKAFISNAAAAYGAI